MNHWTERADVAANLILRWMNVSEGTFHSWKKRYGKVNEHNGWIPRDHWLEDWEKQAILQFHWDHPLEGYRRLTYMMLDANLVAASASTVYRVLKNAGVLDRHHTKATRKGQGFQQPDHPHRDWHVDISYLNIAGTFYFLCSILDGYSRYIVHWEIREKMEEVDVETILQRAREKFPGVTPRIISDNGPQFIAKDFKHFIRVCGMTHVRTSPYYPQSNGKLERYHRTIKSECLRPGTPLSLEDAQRISTDFVTRYNEQRLHSSIGYVTPRDKLLGREKAIFDERDRKLAEARERRAQQRQRASLDKHATLAMDRAEDTALRGRNRSADPVAKSEDGGSVLTHGTTPSTHPHFAFGTNAINPRESEGQSPSVQTTLS